MRLTGPVSLAPGLFSLDPAKQVVPADRVQQGRVVGGHVPPDHPDHLVVAIAPGHEPALASDQFRHRSLPPSFYLQRNATMLA
jgi:hypothetical protein